MTVLVGVACRDGVILGTDSAMTSTAGMHQRTLQETGVLKIDVHCGEILTATTGSVGLAQRFHQELETMLADKELDRFKTKQPTLYCTELAHKTIGNFQKTISPQQQHPQFGWGLGALVAFVAGNKAHLVEFDSQQFHPELKGQATPEGQQKTRPYTTMGSGQVMADPFIAHASRMLFGSEVPNLSEARLLVAWTLRHVIAYNTGGVAGEMQIAELARQDGKWKAQIVEVGEIAQQVNDIERYIGRYWTDKMKGAPEVPDLAQQLSQPASASPSQETTVAGTEPAKAAG